MPLGALGMQAASEGISGVMGLVLGGINDRRQLKQQQALQDLQIAGQKQLTDYNFQKQMEMWNATSYPAQRAMMEKAGLNPALIYGMGGGGGQSNSVTPGQVTGAEAPKGGGEAIASIGMGMQLQLLQAQKKLLESQAGAAEATAHNQEAEANLKNGGGIQKQNEEISLIHKQGDTELAKQNQIAQDTKLKIEQIQQAARDNKIGNATVNDRIQIIQQEAIGSVLRNTLTKAETALKNAQTDVERKKIQEIVQHITNMRAEISNNTNWANNENQAKIAHSIQQLAEYETDPMNKWLENPSQAVQQIMQMGTPTGVKPITGFRR